MFNIAEKLTEIAAAYPDKTGLIEARSGKSYTFSELEQRSAQYGSYLSGHGIGTGERVMLMVAPSADFICLTFALFKIGAPVILIDPGMGYKNLLRCIEGVKPDYLVGIPKAILFRHLFRKPFRSVRKTFSCGNLLGIPGTDFRKKTAASVPPLPTFNADKTTLAAIIFTTGSTGPPKGVRFEHAIFAAQLQYIKDFYGISPEDIDQPGFPLFGLFSIALGACTVIPDMDPSRPAQVDPVKFVSSLLDYKVTYSFGSPAIWKVVSRYCNENNIVSPYLKKVLMAGAPVPGILIDRVFSLLEQDGLIFTPYGATECLPIVSIEGREILKETWEKTRNGEGTCVGRPLPGIEIKIIRVSDHPFQSLLECEEQNPFAYGEIIVKGSVVTKAYENNSEETRMSKIPDGTDYWHRIGDIGYTDDQGRLWFCGRKAHRVKTRVGTKDTIPCEAIVNEHPAVFRSALVGIDQPDGFQIPVLILELEKTRSTPEDQILTEVRQRVKRHQHTNDIEHFLIHPSFPVDIRHNAKIFREKLKIWAEKKFSERK